MFDLPFCFGYGNPLSFINPGYSWIENIWLSLLPLMFVGLLIGWRFEKFGGYLAVIPALWEHRGAEILPHDSLLVFAGNAICLAS
ncbi:hypothetical protein [uncultured Cohaesibacter sp.]|uniref:hypothetical protein n=1 Tax=uncultured Cohaesibacter sp. TaxID=1002546 RepID=UPI002930BAD5|nr:hypothetical protein [uncultured Cohaesibacter sp.]